MVPDNDAETLKAARERANLSPSQAAKQLNIDYVTLWRMEKGSREPRKSLFKRMARLYGTDPNTLLNWEND